MFAVSTIDPSSILARFVGAGAPWPNSASNTPPAPAGPVSGRPGSPCEPNPACARSRFPRSRWLLPAISNNPWSTNPARLRSRSAAAGAAEGDRFPPRVLSEGSAIPLVRVAGTARIAAGTPTFGWTDNKPGTGVLGGACERVGGSPGGPAETTLAGPSSAVHSSRRATNARVRIPLGRTGCVPNFKMASLPR